MFSMKSSSTICKPFPSANDHYCTFSPLHKQFSKFVPFRHSLDSFPGSTPSSIHPDNPFGNRSSTTLNSCLLLDTMGPDHGVLGATFKVTRGLQSVSMLAVIGITANFISQMVNAGTAPPPVLLATLSIVCPSFRQIPTHTDICRSALLCYIA
jgi:hypothetical protein